MLSFNNFKLVGKMTSFPMCRIVVVWNFDGGTFSLNLPQTYFHFPVSIILNVYIFIYFIEC